MKGEGELYLPFPPKPIFPVVALLLLCDGAHPLCFNFKQNFSAVTPVTDNLNKGNRKAKGTTGRQLYNPLRIKKRINIKTKNA